MILIKYSKTDGAEYLSHLDMLKTLGRIFRRMGVNVELSKGYSPHMLVYMSQPIGVGVKSISEYCLIETFDKVDGFKEKFNLSSPRGIKCINAWETQNKVKVASDIVKAQYFITGINCFDVNEILNGSEFIIKDKNGNDKNVRELIYSVEKVDGGIRCVLGFGNGLRIEKFAERLVELYGGNFDFIKEKGELTDGREIEETL